MNRPERIPNYRVLTRRFHDGVCGATNESVNKTREASTVDNGVHPASAAREIKQIIRKTA
jgi:hypothetical protein